MEVCEVYYEKQKGRLVFIEESSTPDFWDSHWEAGNLKTIIERGKNSRLIMKTLKKYIPNKKGRILEGGCGTGQIVYCMQAHGYEAIGVDFAKKTIGRIRQVMPQLDVRVGDVRDLEFPDNYFTAYWSLGVIEHFWDGYHNILKEMRRVLINGGYVFVTVPYMSFLRKLKVKLGLYKEFSGEEKGSFSHFALQRETVIRDFEAIGFELLDKKPTSGIKGIRDEISIFKPLSQKLYDYQGESLFVRGFRFILDRVFATFAGHMILLVFRNIK